MSDTATPEAAPTSDPVAAIPEVGGGDAGDFSFEAALEASINAVDEPAAERNSAERQLAKASLNIAQRWFGHSEPVTAPSARLTHLFEPVDARAPQAAHMVHELRQLGHLLSVGWRHAPYADDDETILEAAIPEGKVEAAPLSHQQRNVQN